MNIGDALALARRHSYGDDKKMHESFSRVHQRSYDVFVGNSIVHLDPLMMALAVDPLEAEDAASSRSSDIPHSLEYFSSISRLAYLSAIETISQWVLHHPGEQKIKQMAMYSPRLAVWCTAQAVRDVLRLLPPEEERPLTAVATAERWVMGESSGEQCLADARDSMAYSEETVFDQPANSRMASAAVRVGLAASTADEASDDPFARAAEVGLQTDNAIYEAASAAATLTLLSEQRGSFKIARDRYMDRMYYVVSMSCFSFPMIP